MATREGREGRSTQVSSNRERRAGSSAGGAAAWMRSCIGPAGVEAELRDRSFLLLLLKGGCGRWSCRWMVPSLSSSSSSQLSLPPSSGCGACHSACLQSCLLHPSLSVQLSLIHSIIPPSLCQCSLGLSLSFWFSCFFLSLSFHLTLVSNFALFSNSVSLAGSLFFSLTQPSVSASFSSPVHVLMSRERRILPLFPLCLQLQGRDWEMNVAHTGLGGDQIASRPHSLF